MAKVDKRSRRDKLKDNIVNDICIRIEGLQAVNIAKLADIKTDELMIAMLKDQLENIEKLCDDGKKAT